MIASALTTGGFSMKQDQAKNCIKVYQMDKIGNKTGSVGWGQSPSAKKPAAGATLGGSGNQQFKRALEVGSRAAREPIGQQAAKEGSKGQAAEFPASAASRPASTAVYETTKIMDCNDFVRQFPETKQSIQPIIELNKHKQMPTIAMVSCSSNRQEGGVERIGNTIFISRDAATAGQQLRLSEPMVMALVSAIGQCLGSN